MFVLPTVSSPPGGVVAIMPEPGDAFSVFLPSGQAVRYGADNRPQAIFAHPEFARPWGQLPGDLDISQTTLGPVIFTLEQNGPACSIEPMEDGSVLKILRISDRRVARQRDLDGGVWARDWQGGLRRYARNCNMQRVLLPAGLDVSELHALPSQVASFAATFGGEVLLADLNGLVWQTSLPQFADQLWRPDIRSGLLGKDFFMAPYLGTDGHERLASVSPTGQLAWTWRNASNDELLLTQAYDSGALLVTAREAIFLDTLGREMWRQAHGGEWFLAMAQPRADDAHAWLQWIPEERAPDCDEQQYPDGCPIQLLINTLRLSTGERIDTTLNAELWPLIGKADGGLILRNPNAGWSNVDLLVHASIDGQIEALPLPELSTAQEFQLIHRDAHGVLAATRASGSWTLYAMTPDFRLRWQLTRSSEYSSEAQVRLAADASQACILAQWQGGEVQLECFDRLAGTASFAPISWSGADASLNPKIGAQLQVIYRASEQSRPLQRRRFDLSGGLIAAETGFIDGQAPIELELREILYSPAGHTIIRHALALPSGGWQDEELLVLGPGHEPGQAVFRIDLPAQFSEWTRRVNHDDRKISVTENAIALATPARGSFDRAVIDAAAYQLDSGERTWQQQLDLGFWRPEFHLDFQGEDWILAALNRNRLRLMRLSSNTGDVMLDRQHALAHWFRTPDFNLSPLSSIFAADLSASAVVIPRDHGTQVLWFDSRNGDRLGAGLHPLRVQKAGSSSTGAPGPITLLAGTAPAADWPAPALLALSLPSRRPAVDAPVAGFGGSWYSPATTGQGWFIDVLDYAGKIFGAWFTFDDQASSEPASLRWYTMLGDFPGADGVATLTLFANNCGVFDSAPPTESREIGQVRMWQTQSGGLQMMVDWFGDVGGVQEVVGTNALDLISLLPGTAPSGVQHWFDPSTAGQGLLLGRPLEDEGPLTVAWFTYDLPGPETPFSCRRWFTAIGPPLDEPFATREARLLQTVGGSLDGRPTRNTVEIGTIRLTTFEVNPSGCDTLLFEYEFDDTDVAGSFAGLSGWRMLQTTRPCGDQ